MLCSNCKKRDATHTVYSDSGEETNLCDSCFERLGGIAAYLDDGTKFFANFLSDDAKTTVKCPCCGKTYSDYTKTGLLGCAECYRVFYEDLMPTIRRIHGKTQHEGKRPLGNGTIFELSKTLKVLRRDLECAICENRTKDAERINRDIRDITQAIYEEGNDNE